MNATRALVSSMVDGGARRTGAHVPDMAPMLRQVLAHTAKLRDLRAAEIMFLPRAERAAACKHR